MTEDNTNADEIRSREHRESQTDDAEVDWADVAADPDPETLGYERSEWERIPAPDDDQVIFLPGNEEDLEDDAFLVLNDSDLCDLVTRR